MSEHTRTLPRPDGSLAYELSGTEGPLVVLAHGLGDSKEAYRFLAPLLVGAGYRVAAVDLRGCGASSAGWPAYSRTAVAADLVALVEHLGEPAVLVGHSIAGGAATIAAADAPASVSAVVELAPFTRKQQVGLADLRSPRVRRGALLLLRAALLGRVGAWEQYLDLAYPGAKPADWSARLEQIRSMLGEPGRTAAFKAMARSSAADAGARLGDVTCPVLVVQGSLDPDWADPEAEGRAVVAALPSGLGRLAVVEGAGHYPHVQAPEDTARLVLDFLASTTRA